MADRLEGEKEMQTLDFFTEIELSVINIEIRLLLSFSQQYNKGFQKSASTRS